MNLQEFSTEFDVLYNNITSNQAPGLNEYEKSVFLTNGQLQLLIEHFDQRTDAVGGGFDGSIKRQYDFSGITRTEVVEPYVSDTIYKTDSKSELYKFPSDYFLSVSEILEDKTRKYSVLPISYNEYQRLLLKPYPYPTKRGVWRLTNTVVSEVIEDKPVFYPIVELIGIYNKEEAEYKLKYVRKPNPIILEDLSTYGLNLSIDGKQESAECKLPEETHREILERAVTLAKIAWQGGTLSQVSQAQKNG